MVFLLRDLYAHIVYLVAHGLVRISEHGYEELAADQIRVADILTGLNDALIVEEYPNFPKGKCILLLQYDAAGKPVHVLWGIPKGHDQPAVLVTAYRPDPTRWDPTFMYRID